MNSKLEKRNKVGEGAYGIVYKAKLTKDDKEIEVAVKRNYGDQESLGISCIREMNFLTLFSHPCITKLKNISVGDPFSASCPMTPRPRRNQMKEDSHHFILELAEKSLEDFYLECEDYYQLKIIMCQVLLGIEYIHSKGVVHRDLKPGNILINIEDGMPYAKICDFGLSCYPSNYRPSTPGAVTSWYRAPEVCCEYYNYSFPSDVWSIGCIFYEMLMKKPLIQTRKESCKHVFKEIINTVPGELSKEYVSKYIKNGWCDYFKHGYINKYKKSFEKMLRERVDEEDFNSEGGTYLEFCELLNKILILDYEKRYTATDCLKDPFFSVFTPYIEEMRNKYPVDKKLQDSKIKIIDCLERRWAINIMFKIYNNRDDVDWYSDHIVFHTIRLFDEYLEHFYRDLQRDKCEKGIGRLHTEQEVNIIFYTCIYIIYKYFSTLYKIHKWTEIFPKHIGIKENSSKVETYERLCLKHVCKYSVFKPTILEYLDRDYIDKSQKERDLDVRKYLINYGNIEMDYEGTMEDLYSQIRNGLTDSP